MAETKKINPMTILKTIKMLNDSPSGETTLTNRDVHLLVKFLDDKRKEDRAKIMQLQEQLAASKTLTPVADPSTALTAVEVAQLKSDLAQAQAEAAKLKAEVVQLKDTLEIAESSSFIRNEYNVRKNAQLEGKLATANGQLGETQVLLAKSEKEVKVLKSESVALVLQLKEYRKVQSSGANSKMGSAAANAFDDAFAAAELSDEDDDDDEEVGSEWLHAKSAREISRQKEEEAKKYPFGKDFEMRF
jgi:hypothetical protein